MPRYMIERTFPNGLALSPNAEGKKVAETVIAANADHGVTWVHSYVSLDKKKTYCLYEAPNAEAIRIAARRANVPADVIIEIGGELRPDMFA